MFWFFFKKRQQNLYHCDIILFSSGNLKALLRALGMPWVEQKLLPSGDLVGWDGQFCLLSVSEGLAVPGEKSVIGLPNGPGRKNKL